MRNPGLAVFSGPVMTEQRPSINDDVDPDRREAEESSDFTPPAEFGRWRNPGHPIKVPFQFGPPYQPGESPHEVMYGELLTKEDQASADRILNGDHDSDHPSDDHLVERARQDLHTDAAGNAVETLSGLLSGGSPEDVGGLDEAHDYLSRHFTGIRINPHHGTLLARSPAGTQMVVHKRHLPAIPEEPEPAKPPVFSLTNKHGTFESPDPKRIIRTMVAFQIVHNALERKKREEEEDQNGLNTTSGFMHDLVRGGLGKQILHNIRHGVPTFTVPKDAIFEPGHGTDQNDKGHKGGWVSSHGLPGWHHDARTGVYYSPGHSMGLMLDPARNKNPHNDPNHLGHTFTYAPNPETGHTIERQTGGITYFVNRLHPAARGKGFDVPRPSGPGAVPRPAASPTSPAAPAPRRPMPPPSRPRKTTSSTQVNDLCPVCASGYLEPYDNDFHECLNCASLVKHIGFERQAAARPKGGLGRGLKQIMEYTDDPLNLGTGGSENPENMPEDAPEEGYAHPLAGVERDPDYVGYEAPKGRLLDKQAGQIEDEEIEEHLGKLGFQPHHGRSGRMYVMPDPHIDGAYYRLTEGVPTGPDGPRGWALTADHVSANSGWTKDGDSVRHLPIERKTNDPTKTKMLRQPLPDTSNRPMSEKNILATGTHPIEDDNLNRALRDVAKNGRNSATYQNTFMDTAYEAPRPPVSGPDKTQRDLRLLSSLEHMAFPVISSNPGLVRFGDWDTSEVNDEPCTHCNGSGVDPEHGDICSRCEGSGDEPSD